MIDQTRPEIEPYYPAAVAGQDPMQHAYAMLERRRFYERAANAVDRPRLLAAGDASDSKEVR
jgi:L-fucose mutarotase/ribose pyranase (RbsD/FucU family)